MCLEEHPASINGYSHSLVNKQALSEQEQRYGQVYEFPRNASGFQQNGNLNLKKH